MMATVRVMFALAGYWFVTIAAAQQANRHVAEPDLTQQLIVPELDMFDDRRELKSLFGPYPLHRDASATGWQPDATRSESDSKNSSVWLTATGFADAISFVPGNAQLQEANLLTFHARHVLGNGTLGLRGEAIFPVTERAAIIESQVDHRAGIPPLLAFAASYSWALTRHSAIFGYIGLPGEPALGTSLYAHPLAVGADRMGRPDKHWFDSRGFNSNVVTVGYVWRNLKLEGSAFDERARKDKSMAIGSFRPFGLSSGRISFNPSPNWALQISRGQRNRPDQLDPDDEIRRTTVSAIHNRVFDRNNWQTTLAVGRRAKNANGSTNAFLLESVLKMQSIHTFFGRFERASSDELFAEDETLHGQSFDAKKFTLGYVHDLAAGGPVRFGIGALASKRFVPSGLGVSARTEAASYKIFVRLLLQFP